MQARLVAPLKVFIVILFGAVAAKSAAQTPAPVPYSANFESGIGAEWSSTNRDASASAFTAFTGRFANAEAQTLSLSGLNSGTAYTVSFDFYVIDSWDGGGDQFAVDANGVEVFRNSFANYNGDNAQANQNYPFRPDVGRFDLGFINGYYDSIYRNIEVTFTNVGTTATITFRGVGLQPINDESWGVDNVQVRTTASLPVSAIVGGTIPAPGSTSVQALDGFTITANRNLRATEAGTAANYGLIGAGPNGTFGDAGDFTVTLTPTFTIGKTVSFGVSTVPLQPGKYRFTALNLVDANAQAVQSYTNEFTIAHPVLGQIESASNNTLQEATTLTIAESPAGSGFLTGFGAGVFSPATDNDFWRFDAESGDRVSVFLRAEGLNIYPDIILRNAANQELTRIFGSYEGYALLQNFIISTPGTYYIQVFSRNNVGGRYSFRVDQSRRPELEVEANNTIAAANNLTLQLSAGSYQARVAGAITPGESADFYRLGTLNVGNAINVSIAVPDGSELTPTTTQLAIYVEGQADPVATSSSGTLSHTVAVNGVHFVKVESATQTVRAQYLATITITDGVGPVVNNVTLPAEASTTTEIVNGFTVTFSEPVDGGFARLPGFQYYNGHAYALTASSVTWAAAEAEAVGRGGHLVTINNAAENTWVNAVFGSGWIGFTDQASEGDFTWISGESSTFTAWSGGEPNNSGGAENWAGMLSSGVWNDYGAVSTLRGIIEVEGADADSDGIPDAADPYPTDKTNGFELRSAGADDVFGNGDDRVYMLTSLGYSGGLSASFLISDGPLQPGKLRLTISTSITDRAENHMSSAYVRSFDVAALGGFVLENTRNGSIGEATSLSTIANAAGDGSFTPVAAYPAGASPWAIVRGNFNADAHADIAVANRNGHNVSVFLGRGDGSFDAAVNYAVQNGPISIATGDFNEDGNVDLVTGNHDQHSASVLLGNGNGTFQTATNLSGGLSNPRSVVVADLNSDGNQDLVFGNGNNRVTVRLGNGNGTFATEATYTTESASWGVAVGDLNADGRPDVVAGNQGASSVSVLLGNADGTLQTHVTNPVGQNPRWVALGDLNGDNRLDIATMNYNGNNNTFSVLLNAGNGTFGAATTFDSGTSDSYHIVIQDVTGDGKRDLAASGYGNSVVTIAPGNGDGTFGNLISYGVGGNPMNILFADLNGDGRTDFATANYGNSTMAVHFGNRLQALSEDPAGSGLRTGQGRGALANTGDYDHWSFSGNAGDTVVVATDVPGNPSSSGLYFRILNSVGTELRSFYANSQGFGQSAPLVLPATGTYFVEVRYNYQYFGEYRLRVTLAPTPVQIETEDNNQTSQANFPALALNTHTLSAKVLGYISAGDQSGDYYALGNLGVGASINVNFRETVRGPFDQTIRILDRTGAAVFTATEGATNAAFIVPADNQGMYYVRVTGNFSPTDPGYAPGLFSQYLLDVTVTDSVAPTITSLTLPAQNSTNISVAPTFTIGFSQDMLAPTVLTNTSYELRSAGADGLFGNSDDQLYAVVCQGYTAGLSATYRITDGPLQPGKYRFRITTGLQDVAANPIAAEVVREFVVNAVSGFIYENRNNNSASGATPLSAVAAGADGSFLHSVSYPAGSNPWAIVSGKFNADNHLDVAVGNRSGSSVSVYLGNGDGTFSSGVNYAVQGGPISMVSGDFNGDTKLDLAVGNYDNNSGSILLGNGDGTFQTATHFSGGLSNPRGLASADLNGDSKLDLVFGNNSGSSVTVFLGNGDGTFGSNTNFPAANGPWTVQIADVDGNSRLDIVTGNYSADNVSVLLGNGNGTFAAPVSYPIGQNPRSLSLGDLNKDGIIDLATINLNNQFSILFGIGDGTFGTNVTFASQTSDPYDVEIVDINGDGNKDMVGAGLGDGVLVYALGNGNGTFQELVEMGVAGNPMNFVVADVNADSRPDFVTAGYYGNNIAVLLGNGVKNLTEDPVGSGFRTAFGRGNLDSGSDVDFWSFSAKAGDRLMVANENPGNPGSSQLYFEIKRPDGSANLVAWYPDFAGWGQSPPVIIPADGTYYLRVAPNYQYYGEYRFRITLAPASTQLEAEPNNNSGQSTVVTLQNVEGHEIGKLLGYMSVGDSAGDFYSLGNLSGSTTISMNLAKPSTSGLSAIIDVLNSAGAIVASNTPGAATFSYTIPAGGDGAYYLRVTSAGPSRPGDNGPFLSFDGGNARVETGAWAPGTNWTVQAWVRPSAIPAGRRGIAGSFSGCQDWGLAQVDGQLIAAIRPPGECSGAIASGVFVSIDQWYHVTATSDGTTARIYVNGELKGSGPVDPAFRPTTAGMWIGGEVCCGAYFPGLIDDVRVWNRTLATEEVAASMGNILTGAESGLAGYWKFDEHTGTALADLSGQNHNGNGVGNLKWVRAGATSATGLGFASQYILNVDLADTVPPTVASVSLPAEGATSTGLETHFSVTYSKDMSPAAINSSTNYSLRAAGIDGTFGTGDDVVYAVVSDGYVSGLTANYSVTDGPLQPGIYRFTIGTGVRSRSGTALTTPYVRNFAINAVAGFFLEPRFNDTTAVAGTLSSNLLSTPDGSFVVGGSTAVGSNPYSIATADFDGDGIPDLVTANYSSANVSLLRGNGDGTFQPATNTAVGQNGPIALLSGDFNKDGRPDVAVANRNSDSMTVLLRTTTGFDAPVIYAAGNAPRGIGAADFNADGNLDLVVPNESSDNISVFLGRADGTFQARVNYAAGDGAFGVTTGDFNTDGRRDIAVANQNSDDVSVFIGAGDGTFGSPVVYPLGANARPRGISAVDLNGDGRLDLMTVGAGVNRAFVLTGKLDGTFNSPVSYDSGGSDPYGILVTDVNGDGWWDVVVANYGSSRLGILLGNGDGTLSEVMNYSIAGNPIAIAIGHFDSDPSVELAVANYSAGTVTILDARTSQPLIAENPASSGLRTVAARGQIFNSVDTDFWSFSADAGDSITLAFQTPGNPSSSSLNYRVIRPDGEILFSVNGTGTGWGEGTGIIPASGTYFVQVRQSQAFYGEYRFRVSLARKPLQMESEDNDARTRGDGLNFAAVSGKRTATITGYTSLGDGGTGGDFFAVGNIAEGTTIQLTLTKPTNSAYEGTITILKADGVSVASAASTAGSLNYTIPSGAGGAYYVQLTASSGALDYFSQYLLKVELSDSTPPAIVSTTLPTEGSTTLAVYDRFAIGFNKDMNAALVNAGGSYDLRAAGDDGNFGTADDQRYTVVPGTYSAGLSATFSITDGPLQAGSYRFSVTGLRDLFGNTLPPFTRSFVIEARDGFTVEDRDNGTAVTATPLAFVEIQTGLKTGAGRGNLTSTGDLDFWSFEGNAGDRISVGVENPGFPGSSQLYYRIDRPDGTMLFDFYSDGNGSGEYDDAVLPVAGTYVLRVRYNNDYQGEYNLRVTVNSSAVQLEREANETVANATALTFTTAGSTRNSSGAGYVRRGTDVDYYNLGTLTNGSTVFLAVRVPSGSTLDPVVGVYNAANGYVTEVTGGRATDGVAQVQITSTGTYYAVVRGNDGSSGLMAHYILDAQVVPTGSVSFPNLQVTSITPLSGTINSGDNVAITFVVSNAGSSATAGSSWTDRVVLSSNTTLGDTDDVTLGIFNRSGTLAAGANYNGNVNGRLPDGISGQFYILVQTDFGNDVNEFVLEGDNSSASAAFAVTLAPYADLKVENLAVTPGTGGTYNIAWNTANRGQRAVNTAFKERVIVRNVATGISLLNAERDVTNAIAISGTLPQTASVNVAGFGTFEVIITTDSRNGIYEFDAVSHTSAEQNTAQTTFQVFQDLAVAVSVNPASAGTVTGAGTFQSGSTVTVTASPITTSLPYQFLNWTENGQFQSGSASYSFTLNSARQLLANFVLPTYQVAATAVPSNGGTISGRGSYPHGSSVILTATPALGYKFVNWSESNVVVSTSASLTNIITTNRTFVASFSEANVQHIVTTETSPAGVTNIAGAGTYTNGASFQFTAPNRVTNSATIYTFQEFRINGSVVTSLPTYTKSFSTLDPTNLTVTAVYQSQSIRPVIAEVIRNFQDPAPATTNFLLSLRFDRSMNPAVPLSLVITNPTKQSSIVVPNTGVWSTGTRPTDTYSAPAIALSSAVEGTNILIASGGRDTVGTQMQETNATTVVVDATAPTAPVISLVSSNGASATFSWSGYTAPADLSAFRIYLQRTNFANLTGITPLGGVDAAIRNYTLNGLQLDTNYFVAVVALDAAGNASGVNTFPFNLGSTVPPPVALQATPSGSDAVTLSWSGYNTTNIIGFAEFRLYYENTPFTSVASLAAKETFSANERSVVLENLDRSKTFYFALVGVNRLGQFNPAVTTARWSDPYSGTISSNLTIGSAAENVVDIYAPITVANGAVLTVSPGTTLRFANGAGITVQSGRLIAEGTALDPITFTSANDQVGSAPAAGDWEGVTLSDAAGVSRLAHVFIKYGKGLTVNAGTPVLTAFSALYNAGAGLNTRNSVALETAEAFLAYNDVGLQQGNASRLVVRNSIIKNNDTNAWANGSNTLIATQNWWGTTVQTEIGGLVLGSVTTTGNLGTEPVLTPAAEALDEITQTSSRNLELRLAARGAESVRLSEDSTFAGAFYGPYTNRTSFQLSEGGGQKTVYVQFRSVTGGTSTPLAVNVNYVTGGPVISAFNLTEGLVLNRPFTVTASATAPVGMRALELYIDGQPVGTNSGSSLSLTLDTRNFSDAVHRARLVARDLSGSIAVSECNITVANVPPPAPVITGPVEGAIVNTPSFSVQGTAEPNSAVRVTRNGAAIATVTATAAGTFSASGLTLVEGRNRIVATAFDAIGSTPSTTVNVYLDTVVPERLILDTPVYQPGTGLQFTWRYSPTGKQPTKYELFWSQTPFTTTNQATGRSLVLIRQAYTLQGLANGTWQFRVIGYDDVGNASALSDPVSFAYDALPPVFTLAFDKSSPVGTGPLHLTLTANEALAATPSLTMTAQGAPPILVHLTGTAVNTYEATLTIGRTTGNGPLAFNVTGQDLQGNQFRGAPNGATVIIDTHPPVATIITSPLGPIQATNSTNVSLTVRTSEPIGAATTPTLNFAPPIGEAVPITLTGSGTNWSGVLTLTAEMGSGFGQFTYSGTDAVGNNGTDIASGASLEIYNTTLPTAPNAPTALQATAIAGGQIRLSWNPVTNAEIYRVYREAGTNIVTPTLLVVDNLTTNGAINLPATDGPYRYGVTASRRGAESPVSGTIGAVSDRLAPAAPTSVAAQLASSGVLVTWTQPGTETPKSYNIYRNGQLIRTIQSGTSVTDYPPRGIANYTIGALDTAGNEAVSTPASISLLVGGVRDLVAVATMGQPVALSWANDDNTAVGFNVYRNGLKQNASVLAQPNYVDPLPVGNEPVTYGITARNAAGDEGAPRTLTVYPAELRLLVNAPLGGNSGSLTTRYFDEYRVSLANLSSTSSVPVSRFEIRRTIDGADTLNLSRTLNTAVAPGQSVERRIAVPQPQFAANERVRARAVQQGDSTVIYEKTFELSDVSESGLMINVAANQLPLAGGLSTLQVQVFNRGFADLNFITATDNGAKPGDVYVSVKNSQGQEVGRTLFTGTPPGTFFLNDGRAFVRIAGGASVSFSIPNVLVAEALGTNQATFEVVVAKTYSGLNTPDVVENGELRGSMVSSLAQTPYYGTAQTSKTGYADEEPIIITGQALDRQTGSPVPNSPLKIGFSARGFRWTRDVTTDASGNFTYEYTPTPGFAGNLNIWAAHPLVFDQLNQVAVTYYRLYPTPYRSDIRMSKNDTLPFSISLVNPGDVPLTGFTLEFNAYQLVGTNRVSLTNITGTASLAEEFTVGANKTVPVLLGLQAAANAPDNAIVEYILRSAEGGSAKFVGVVTLLPAVPVLTMTDPTAGYLEVSLNRGQLLSRQITIQNKGLKELKGVTLAPPSSNTWMQVNLPISDDGQIRLPDLGVGQSHSFSVVFTPPADTALDFYSDEIIVRGTNSTAEFSLKVYALVTSSQKGSVQFFVDNILGDPVPNASVRMRSGLLQMELPVALTDSAGLVTISDIPEGDWSWQVLAPGHSGSVGSIKVTPSQTVQVHTRLSKSLVTINFSVVPVPYTDKYEIKLEQTFETHVPAPVIIVDPAFKDFKNVSPGFEANFIVTVKNHGLIAMDDVVIKGSQVNGGALTPMIEYFPRLLPQETVEVPFVFTYNTPGTTQQGQRRQLSGDDIAQCLVGAMPFGSLADPAFFQGLAAIFSGGFYCITDLTPQQALATVGALFALSQVLGAIGSAQEFLIGFVGGALSCIIGNLLPSWGGDGGNSTSPGGHGTGTYGLANAACFSAGTSVLMADGRSKPIEEIQPNDVIRVGPRSSEVARVSRTFAREQEEVLEIEWTGGTVRATREHRFWIDGKGWIAASDLKAGDYLSNSEGERVRIRRISEHRKKEPVYTFSVTGDNVFYANGVLVHDMCALENEVITTAIAGGKNAE
ncbi:MAG TPA: FG-GAP-like repeat-containing protein [Verrucomicrobiae bacterium]